MVECTPKQLQYAQSQLGYVWDRLVHVRSVVTVQGSSGEQKEELETARYEIGRQNIITDCQIIIENSVKLLFPLMGFAHNRTHAIGFNEKATRGLIEKTVMNRDFKLEDKDDIMRAVFLTQFWEGFYTLAKYGVPKQGISGDDIFRVSDSRRAIQDAEFCFDLAERFHSYQANTYKTDTGNSYDEALK